MLETNKIYEMDCLEGIKMLQDNSVDLIVTDPPYNISQSKSFRNSDGSVGFKGWKPVFEKWDCMTKEEYLNFLEKLLIECKRVSKPKSSLYIFGNHQSIFDIAFVLKKLDFTILNLITWHKPNGFPMNYNHTRYANNSEYIIFGRFGKSHNFYYKKFERDLWVIVKEKETEHPTEKPIFLIRKCIKNSSKENDLILDCFMGSGTTAVACKQINRNFVGFEINKDYVQIANQRLSQKTLNTAGVFTQSLGEIGATPSLNNG